MELILVQFFNNCFEVTAAGVIVMHDSNSTHSPEQLSVAFGTCEAFNQKIDNHVDRERFHHRVVDFRLPLRMSNFDLVVPLTIGDVLRLARNYPAQNGYRFIVADPEVVMLAHNKSNFNSFLARNGFESHLPPAVAPSTFPLVVKKNQDSGGKHTVLIQNQQDQQENNDLMQDKDYFVQAYVPGDVEYTTHMLYFDGVCFDCTIEFKMNRSFYIRGANMQPFDNVQLTVVETPFRETFDAVLKTLGFQGICCFNYKIVDGKPIIFELNPRFGGSLPREINRLLSSMYSVLQLNR